MEHITRITRQVGRERHGIVLHIIADENGRRIHLARNRRHRDGRLDYIMGRQLTACSALIEACKHKGTISRNDEISVDSRWYARTFYKGCAGHWSAFRNQLRLEEPETRNRRDFAFYDMVHRAIMMWLQSPGWTLANDLIPSLVSSARDDIKFTTVQHIDSSYSHGR